MYYASAKLAYCMPVDPYSLIVAAKRYHAVRGAVIAMDFIRDRKQRNVLQVSEAAPRSNISKLPIEVIDAIALKLLAADNHDARCDCWVRFPAVGMANVIARSSCNTPAPPAVRPVIATNDSSMSTASTTVLRWLTSSILTTIITNMRKIWNAISRDLTSNFAYDPAPQQRYGQR